jgi:hypothetical protein
MSFFMATAKLGVTANGRPSRMATMMMVTATLKKLSTKSASSIPHVSSQQSAEGICLGVQKQIHVHDEGEHGHRKPKLANDGGDAIEIDLQRCLVLAGVARRVHEVPARDTRVTNMIIRSYEYIVVFLFLFLCRKGTTPERNRDNRGMQKEGLVARIVDVPPGSRRHHAKAHAHLGPHQGLCASISRRGGEDVAGDGQLGDARRVNNGHKTGMLVEIIRLGG